MLALTLLFLPAALAQSPASRPLPPPAPTSTKILHNVYISGNIFHPYLLQASKGSILRFHFSSEEQRLVESDDRPCTNSTDDRVLRDGAISENMFVDVIVRDGDARWYYTTCSPCRKYGKRDFFNLNPLIPENISSSSPTTVSPSATSASSLLSALSSDNRIGPHSSQIEPLIDNQASTINNSICSILFAIWSFFLFL